MTVPGSPKPPNESELAELFRTHRNGLAGAVRAILGSPEDGAEVLQDAFVNAIRALRKGHRPVEPAAWIFVVTINTARDRRRLLERRRGRHQGLEEVAEMELTAKDQAPPQRAVASETLAAARAAIARLAEPEKDVFLLRVSGGMTFEATAAALEIPIGTAKSRMRSALSRLRGELGAFAPENAAATARQER